MKMTAENKRIRAANQTWLNRTAIIREAGKLDIKAENEAIARAAQEKAEAAQKKANSQWVLEFR